MKFTNEGTGFINILTKDIEPVNLHFTKEINIRMSCVDSKPVEAEIIINATDIDIIGFCKGLNRDIRIVAICPLCGELKCDCICEGNKGYEPLSNACITLREVDGSILKGHDGEYVQNINILQNDPNEKPLIVLARVKTEDGKVVRDGNPILEIL